VSAAAPGEVIYLDHAATTPVDPRVARVMGECLTQDGVFANPSSATHVPGRRAARRVEEARAQVAALVGAQPSEVIFTSGATESNNLAILGAARGSRHRGSHIVTLRTEHRAVLDPCRQLEKEGFRVSYLVPGRDGVLAPEALAQALRPETVLVSVMHANNEIGVIQDIAAIGALCRERGLLLHCDAAQSAGKIALEPGLWGIDLLSFTAHKLYGPKGIGALLVAPAARAHLLPLMFGGGQERGLRSGTLATHQIVGFGLACEIAARERTADAARLMALRERLWSELRRLPDIARNGHPSQCLPGILNVSFGGVEGESLVTALGDLAVSTGSACSSALGEPSYVLRALGRPAALAESSLRFSLGRGTAEQEVVAAAASVCRAVEWLRAVASGAERGPAPHVARDAAPSLSPLVRELFRSLPGAGSLPRAAGTIVRGAAGEEGSGARVQFELLVAGEYVKEARFSAWGCPHTLAVAAWVAARLPGRSRSALLPGTVQEWRQALAVPVEKLGRLLIVEDAVRGTHLCWPAMAVT
jgi:cysteine desulfurase